LNSGLGTLFSGLALAGALVAKHAGPGTPTGTAAFRKASVRLSIDAQTF